MTKGGTKDEEATMMQTIVTKSSVSTMTKTEEVTLLTMSAKTKLIDSEQLMENERIFASK